MDYDSSQQVILQFIKAYEDADGKAPNLYKKAKKQIDIYELELLDGMAAESRLKWLQEQKERLNKIKGAKILVKDEVRVKDIMAVGEDIDKRMDEILKDTEEGIQASTYIRIQLEKQIEALDLLGDQNKQFKSRIKKAKKGLRVIIRRAMMNKCTRFLMVLVLLAVIGLIVVTILVDNGIINIDKN